MQSDPCSQNKTSQSPVPAFHRFIPLPLRKPLLNKPITRLKSNTQKSLIKVRQNTKENGILHIILSISALKMCILAAKMQISAAKMSILAAKMNFTCRPEDFSVMTSPLHKEAHPIKQWTS
ncbi:hypothetical protein AOQ65_17160 [Bacteroides fragilis]|nr:hypothetical protein AOQ65_17160 [Bacteroides fragilis]OCM99171.1 hypothetical protein AE749_02585 [Bacteroides fragilis]